MTKNDQNSGPEPPEQADSFSATAMFLKAFDADAKKPSEPAAQPAPWPAANSGDRQAYAPAAPPPSANGPGEFTQMFNSLGQRPASAPPPPRETPPQAATHVVKGPPAAPADQGSGDITRIFVPGATPANAPPARPPEETLRPAPPSAGPSRSKGFSSPGVSDSASAEGSFTQFFSNTPRPAASPQSSVPPPPPAPAPAPYNPPPAPDTSWKNDPFFRPVEKSSAAENPSPSVTSILSSLATSGPGSSAPRAPEPAPYRPEPLPSYAPPKPAEEAGGVTRLIQRLAQEPPASAAPPPSAPPPPAPAGSGPGEFTRMIQGLGARPASPAAPAAPAPPPPAAPVFAMPAPPPMPKIAPPPMAAHAAPAPPAFAAPAVPAIPKPAPPPPLAIAAPKTKLEAMVPILLVINTFLLVLLLVVVIFLIKAR